MDTITYRHYTHGEWKVTTGAFESMVERMAGKTLGDLRNMVGIEAGEVGYARDIDWTGCLVILADAVYNSDIHNTYSIHYSEHSEPTDEEVSDYLDAMEARAHRRLP